MDPLGENAGLIAARAHLELGDEQSAAAGLHRTESAPVHVEGLQLRPSGPDTSLQGRVVGNAAEPGTSVHLRFTFYGADGALGTEPLTVSAPPPGVRESFEIIIRGASYGLPIRTRIPAISPDSVEGCREPLYYFNSLPAHRDPAPSGTSSRTIPSYLLSRKTWPPGPGPKRRSEREAGDLPCSAFFS